MNVQLFDSTLRDGTQSEGLSLSVEDKLKIARLLDGFGIHYIEGGYPGRTRRTSSSSSAPSRSPSATPS